MRDYPLIQISKSPTENNKKLGKSCVNTVWPISKAGRKIAHRKSLSSLWIQPQKKKVKNNGHGKPPEPRVAVVPRNAPLIVSSPIDSEPRLLIFDSCR